MEGRKRRKETGKLKINGIVSRSVIYLSGRTQGSEFWGRFADSVIVVRNFRFLYELLSSLEEITLNLFISEVSLQFGSIFVILDNFQIL